MLFAKQSLILARAQLADFRHEVEIAHDRYTAGDLDKLDYERLDLQLGSFESDVANDTIGLQQASDQLQTLMGALTPSAAFEIVGDIVPPMITQTHDQLVALALVNRPDIAAARSGIDVANSAYRLAVANGTTDPTVEAEYDRVGPDNSAGFSVNVPLRIFDRNQGNRGGSPSCHRLQARFYRNSRAEPGQFLMLIKHGLVTLRHAHSPTDSETIIWTKARMFSTSRDSCLITVASR